MATNIFPDAQTPIYKCEICSRGVDARFYCKECIQELCKDCKAAHLRIKICQNHTIITIAKEKDAFDYELAFSKTTCRTHGNMPVQMFCVSCDVPVCLTCKADITHKSHVFDQLCNIADGYRKELLSLITETKQKISILEKSLQSLHSYGEDYIKKSDKTISGINQQRDHIKSMVDTIANDLISDVQKRKDEDTNSINKGTVEVQKRISDGHELQQLCEEKRNSYIDASVKSFITDIRNKLKSISSPMKAISPPVFVRTDVLEKYLQEIFGKLDAGTSVTINTDPTPAGASVNITTDPTPAGSSVNINTEHTPAGTSVNIKTDVISSILSGIPSSYVGAVSDTEAWFGSKFGIGEELILRQKNGTIKKKVKLQHSVDDITVTSSGDVIFTELLGHVIKLYSSDKVTIIADTTPYFSKGLCVTTNEDLLVCLYNTSRKNDNKVVRMSLNGQIRQTIQYDRQNKPLVSDLNLVTENINGDIFVVDDNRTVVVVNKYGQFRFMYPESRKSTHTIGRCFGLACDKLGYILISDADNSRIHQIDSDGKFVQFVLTEQHGIENPLGLSIDDKGQLWVCNNYGIEVKVYKYRS